MKNKENKKVIHNIAGKWAKHLMVFFPLLCKKKLDKNVIGINWMKVNILNLFFSPCD